MSCMYVYMGLVLTIFTLSQFPQGYYILVSNAGRDIWIDGEGGEGSLYS